MRRLREAEIGLRTRGEIVTLETAFKKGDIQKNGIILLSLGSDLLLCASSIIKNRVGILVPARFSFLSCLEEKG